VPVANASSPGLDAEPSICLTLEWLQGVVEAASGFHQGRYDAWPAAAMNTVPGRPLSDSPSWRRMPWVAVVTNAGFFLAEIIVGAATRPVALQADAVDFFGEAANCAISLGVAGMAPAWRARAAILKGRFMIIFAFRVPGSTARQLWQQMAASR